jgi:hypothetical protein
VRAVAGEEPLVVLAELAVARGRELARHPEQLPEAHVLLPELLVLVVGEAADEQLVEAWT